MALTKEDLQAMGELMDNKLSVALEPINDKLDALQESVDEIRVTQGTLVDWIDVASDVLNIKYPVEK